MKADFDHIAKNYDTDFTHSEIGKRQRNVVYKYLEELPNQQHILELNCGTGEDAIWFAKKINTVLATDISKEMIHVAKEKSKEIKNLKFQQLDVNNLKSNSENLVQKSKFDLIFSNFGGLNCLNKQELQDFFRTASKLLHKNGKLILVIMPKNTLWENIYFIVKGQFKKAFRRNAKTALTVNVAGNKVQTWYFNPKQIKSLSKVNFKVVQTKPIGFFLPPSYLECYFKNHKRFLTILGTLEKTIGRFGFLSRYSDHYMIELQIK